MLYSRPIRALCVCLIAFFLVLAGCAEDNPPSDTEEAAAPVAAVEDTTPSPMLDDSEDLDARLANLSAAAEVKKALARDRELRQFDFDPAVEGGRLVVRGDVDTEAQYDRTAQVAQRVLEGVAITNNVTVLGEAISRDDPGPPETVVRNESSSLDNQTGLQTPNAPGSALQRGLPSP